MASFRKLGRKSHQKFYFLLNTYSGAKSFVSSLKILPKVSWFRFNRKCLILCGVGNKKKWKCNYHKRFQWWQSFALMERCWLQKRNFFNFYWFFRSLRQDSETYNIELNSVPLHSLLLNFFSVQLKFSRLWRPFTTCFHNSFQQNALPWGVFPDTGGEDCVQWRR